MRIEAALRNHSPHYNWIARDIGENSYLIEAPQNWRERVLQAGGIILTRHLALHHNYQLKPLMRNNELYELKVYYSPRHSIIFRDSLKLLPRRLES